MKLDLAVITLVNGQNAWRDLGAVAQSDPRLADARAPLAHTHLVADVTDFDPRSKEDVANKDQLGGYCPIMGDGQVPGNRQRYGSDGNSAAIGNDARLSDPRPPAGPCSGLDVAGSFPGSLLVTGLQAQPLPSPVGDGYLKRTPRNDGWEENADVALASEFSDLRSRFNALLFHLLDQGVEIPEAILNEEDLQPYEN